MSKTEVFDGQLQPGMIVDWLHQSNPQSPPKVAIVLSAGKNSVCDLFVFEMQQKIRSVYHVSSDKLNDAYGNRNEGAKRNGAWVFNPVHNYDKILGRCDVCDCDESEQCSSCPDESASGDVVVPKVRRGRTVKSGA